MGIDRKTLASAIGLLSIVSSLAFWIEVALGKALGHVPGWIDMGLSGWVAGWVLGVLLAGAATILWPKRWWWALLVSPLSFFALLVSVRNVEW